MIYFLKQFYYKTGEKLFADFPVQISVPYDILGREGYGEWATSSQGITPHSVVYSGGIGKEISWDLAMIEKYGVAVHGFDPTPEVIQWAKEQTFPPQFKLHEYGLALHDGMVTFYPPAKEGHISHTLLYQKETAGRSFQVPMKTLSTAMKELGHDHIDILKLDIEGAEEGVIDEILSKKIPVSQIFIEFYHLFVSPYKKGQIIRKLNKAGYKIFYITTNREEYSFIKT